MPSAPSIAIVGIACRYPDARSPRELWENVLAQRRAFRRIPSERLRLEDYHSIDRAQLDLTYGTEAALITDYEFDRARYHVSGPLFRSADMVHWLALDIAAQALTDAGFEGGRDLPRESTGVLLGNSLTGEFSRAATLRLRWPYVRRVVGAALGHQGWDAERRREFLAALETSFKAPFPEMTEESLAGGLSNTIAGRICNHFDLKGGGYTVDGACASSLLAVTTAASALAAGDLDVALAGGVDLSLDPFELVGFARAGALASDQMRVYDVRSAGFWPGEGCGFVVLMRHDDAVALRRPIYALIRGWGVSSDGAGGITRPEVEGQLLALRRAYARAGFGADAVGYFEGHGTGTSVGDATELQVVGRARREANPAAPPAVIGSVKANIGHTKAAAGVAGLIKAAYAVHQRILPPTTGCEEPHGELSGERPALRVLRSGEVWDAAPPRAAVSAMGFGGINSHVVLEGLPYEKPRTLTPQERLLLASAQDAELFLLGAPDAAALGQRVEELRSVAFGASRADLTDLAVALAGQVDAGAFRAAVVAASPRELHERLARIASWLAAGDSRRLDVPGGAFLGSASPGGRIGLLFPGQGTPAPRHGGPWRRRFAEFDALYERLALPAGADEVATQVAQPCIVASTLASLRVLHGLGIEAGAGVGHSLGELAALCWAGWFDEETIIRIAAARGAAMAEHGDLHGAMADVAAPPEVVERLCAGSGVVLAGLNGPQHTVVSGQRDAVAAVSAAAQSAGLRVTPLRVSHAFHSSLVADAVGPLRNAVSRESGSSSRGARSRGAARTVYSTITGAALRGDDNVVELLARQVTSPVRFEQALRAAESAGVALWIELGPGRVLTGLAGTISTVPAVSLDAAGRCYEGLLRAAGASFALGAPLRIEPLFARRFARSFDLHRRPKFFVNPCELAPVIDEPADTVAPLSAVRPGGEVATPAGAPPREPHAAPAPVAAPGGESGLDVVRALVAARLELPVSAVSADSRLLGDLHLNSIVVGQIVTEATRRLGLAAPLAPSAYADATVGAVAQALEEMQRVSPATGAGSEPLVPDGIDTWVRPFVLVEHESPRPPRRFAGDAPGAWRVLAPPDDPLGAALRERFAGAAGGGVVCCLPAEFDGASIALLLEAARALLAIDEPALRRFVLVEREPRAAGLAKSLFLEAPDVTVAVVGVHAGDADAAARVADEALAADGFVEVRYTADGRRLAPRAEWLDLSAQPADPLSLSESDVLLVSGGGKGIGAECALALVRNTGAKLALLGRSRPEDDPALAANLARLRAAGLTVEYAAVDVGDAGLVHVAIRQLQARLGAITGFLHSAGRNEPRLLAELGDSHFHATIRPKVDGLRNVLAALDADGLRLVVAFGSIIARCGLRGEADYAVANALLAADVERWQQHHPRCRCLCVEWSVWSGVGMGERLGAIESLRRAGIAAISPDDGVAMLRNLLSRRLAAPVVVVAGRWSDTPTLRMSARELPFLRFLESPRVDYPGIELVVDCELSRASDPHVDEHVYRGDRLFAAVVGIEALAQAAMAASGRADAPHALERVQLLRPVVVPPTGAERIRLAALVAEGDGVDVALRCAQTGFAADHFRARCRWERSTGEAPPARIELPPESVALDPRADLYGGLLFQAGRFARVQRYYELSARRCVAQIGESAGEPAGRATDAGWFGRALPQRMILGDASVRDAAIHAIQPCIPHWTILPTGVEHIALGDLRGPGPWLVRAAERLRRGDEFTYDMEIADATGAVVERWTGLRLKVIEPAPRRDAWPLALLRPYVERRVEELVPGATLVVGLDEDGGIERRGRTERAVRRALATAAPVTHRPDGRPEAADGHAVSASHAGRLTLATVGSGSLGCDLEPVLVRESRVWADLLGAARFELASQLSQRTGESESTSATRVWTAAEALEKAGAAAAPLTFGSASHDGWAVLSAGRRSVVSYVARLGDGQTVAMAVLVDGADAGV